MVQASTAEFIREREEQAASLRVADFLSKGIFVALLMLLVLVAIPYGTSEPWWKAVFVALVFVLALGWIVEGLLSGSWRTGGRSLLVPLLALAAFSLLQTIPLGSSGTAGVTDPFWNAISADPYQTRLFVLQLLALITAGALLYRYASRHRRVRILIHVIIALAVASAIFGILRQTTQHQPGFGLPRFQPDQGYGQFINKNHFAFLMEMALGLTLGLFVAGGVKRERALIYFASLLPVWTALVLSNSRGGLLAMFAQLIAAALLFTLVTPASRAGDGEPKLVRIARSLPVRIVLVAVLIVGVFIGTIWVGGDRLASNIEAVSAEFDPVVKEARQGANRIEIWKTTWRMFEAHPIAGVGMGGYWTAFTEYHDASGATTPQEAHNDYLELLASGGLIGLALGVWFVVELFRRARENLKSPDRFQRAAAFAATLGITGVAVHSLVDFGLHITLNALVFVALVVIATRKS